MGLIEDIKNQALERNIETNEDARGIEQALNKLYYMETNVAEETKFVLSNMLKNGAAKERVGLHGSSIIASDSDFCYREQVLSLFYKQAQGGNVPIGLKRIFEEGNAIHEKWQRLFIRGGLGTAECMDRSRFVDKYDLSYTPDGCPITIDGIEYVVEIKSVNTYQFQKMSSHPSGRKQLQLYMALTGIHNGFVLCDDKNTQDFKVFPEVYNKETVRPFVARLKLIQEYKRQLLEEGIMVARTEGCNKSSCKRALKCNMREACYNVGKGRVKLNV